MPQADVNECKERTIDVIRAIDKGVLCDHRFAGSACSGRHEYALGKDGDSVRLDMACIRIASSDTDVLLLVSSPLSLEKHQGGASCLFAPADGCKVLEKMIATFRVVDYGLFG